MVTAPRPAKNIVLAEDNSADIIVVRLALKSSGLDCEPHVLDDGEKAITFIEEPDANPAAGVVDLLLPDMHLPGSGGDEILERLRASDDHARTPVVVMTASDAPRDHAQAQEYAAMHYFQKPSDLAGYMHPGIIVRDLLSSGAHPKEAPGGEK